MSHVKHCIIRVLQEDHEARDRGTEGVLSAECLFK